MAMVIELNWNGRGLQVAECLFVFEEIAVRHLGSGFHSFSNCARHLGLWLAMTGQSLSQIGEFTGWF